MATSLAGKPICITGASSGIGAATAIACARAGMPVTLTARREDRLKELAKRIRDSGGRAIYLPVDVTDPEACAKAVDATIDEFGSIYSVFANAGYGVEQPMHEMSDADLRGIYEVNFFGTLNAIRPALPHLLRRRAGHVLICSSCLSKFTLPYYGAYSATKAAQNHVGRAMRLELSPHGVHVSTVHPVGTKTEFFETVKGRSDVEALVPHAPDFLMQRPETVARAVVRCLQRPRPEVWTSRFVQWGMAIGAAMPRVADRAVSRMVHARLRQDAAPPAAPPPHAPARPAAIPDVARSPEQPVSR